jgi:hypothetical protein
MSVKILSFLVLGIAALVGSAFFTLKSFSVPPSESAGRGAPARQWVKPWIEIIRPRVEERDAAGVLIRELETGDEVETGTIVAADRSGLANVYFPDGSVLRLDSETRLVIREARFDQGDEKLMVRISLLSGRAWSKILGLLTPDSLWEVRTSNAVATVRGTAFGVEEAEGITRIIGSEDTVRVAAIEPATGEVLEDVAALVAPDSFVQISAREIPAFKEKEKVFTARVLTNEILSAPWVRRAKEADAEYEGKYHEIRKQEELEGRALRARSTDTVYQNLTDAQALRAIAFGDQHDD